MVALAEALISPVSRCPGRIRQARAQISCGEGEDLLLDIWEQGL